MTKLSKVLAVFVTAVSLAFMGFAAVSAVGGPNWMGYANDLPDYSFVHSGGDNPTWSVKTRVGDESVRTAPELPAVVVAAQQHKVQEQQQELQRLDQEIQTAETRLAEAKALIETDLQALALREAELEAELLAAHEQLDELTQESVEKSQEAQAKRAEAALRREDVFRLTNDLAEIQTDRYRMQEQKKQLEDLLVRLQGSNQRLERRNQQLKETGATIDYDE